MSGKLNKWLYLPMETKTRDFYGRMLIASVAAEAGFNVVLLHKSSLANRLQYLPRGICIFYGVVQNYFKELSLIRNMGYKLAAWDEEGLSVVSPERYLRYRVSLDSFALLDRFFVWGQAQASLVSTKVPDKDKIVPVGHPRFDFLRPELRNLLEHSAEILKKKYGPFILVTTRFGIYNHYNGRDFGMEVLRQKGYFCNPQEKDFYTRRFQYDGERFSSFVKMMPVLSRAFPELTIILRPHPSENIESWRKYCDGLINVKVILEGSAFDWIWAANVVIHNGCTTGIEAFLLKKPCISYRVVTSDEFDIFLPNALSIEVFNDKHLISIIQEMLAKGSYYDSAEKEAKRRKLAEKHISGIEGEMASEQIVYSLHQLNLSSFASNIGLGHQLRLRLYDSKEFLRHILQRHLKGSGAPTYLEHKFPGLKLIEVNEALHNLQKIMGRFNNIRARELGKAFFKIYKYH